MSELIFGYFAYTWIRQPASPIQGCDPWIKRGKNETHLDDREIWEKASLE